MKIGQRLGRALERAGKSQREVADRAKMEESTLSKIITGKTGSPFFGTIEKIVRAADITWGELFDEPQVWLADLDVHTAVGFRELLDRIIEKDAKLKQLRGRGVRPDARRFSVVREAPVRIHDDVEEVADEQIPDAFQRLDANRVYRVLTDAMNILEGSRIFARATQDQDAADGKTVVCRLNDKLYLRRLDRRGGRTMLEAANPRYESIRVDPKTDRFALVAVICEA
ncbi:MAG TPA: helix-turn-helix domain-containing protein [Thermoanaerobaculia bacterium]